MYREAHRCIDANLYRTEPEKRERVRTTFTEKHTDVLMQTYTEINRAAGDGH